MCCIIHRPKGAKAITKYKIEGIARGNPDGWGVSYFKDDKLRIIKSLDMDKALDQIRGLEEEDLEFLFHARYATHGEIDIQNCHPFEINSGVLFHNGRININCKDKRFSDTFYFSLQINKFLRRNRSIEWILNLFKKNVGESRFAIMQDDGTVLKFGKWHDLEGCEFSKLNWRWNTSSYNYDEEYAFWPYGQAVTPAPKKEPWRYINRECGKPVVSFADILADCKAGKEILSYRLRALTEMDLITLALHYPKVCAQFVHKTI